MSVLLSVRLSVAVVSYAYIIQDIEMCFAPYHDVFSFLFRNPKT